MTNLFLHRLVLLVIWGQVYQDGSLAGTVERQVWVGTWKTTLPYTLFFILTSKSIHHNECIYLAIEELQLLLSTKNHLSSEHTVTQTAAYTVVLLFVIYLCTSMLTGCVGLTLLATQQPLHSLNEFVAVAVGIDPDLLQLLVTHVNQHVQGNLEKSILLAPEESAPDTVLSHQ